MVAKSRSRVDGLQKNEEEAVMTEKEFRDATIRIIEIDDNMSALKPRFEKVLDELDQLVIARNRMYGEFCELREIVHHAIGDSSVAVPVRVGGHVFWVSEDEELCFMRLRSWLGVQSTLKSEVQDPMASFDPVI